VAIRLTDYLARLALIHCVFIMAITLVRSAQSHEIRTPMNAVLGVGRLLADTPLSLEQQQLVAMITNSGQLLLTIINDILDYSKIEVRSSTSSRTFAHTRARAHSAHGPDGDAQRTALTSALTIHLLRIIAVCLLNGCVF